MSIKKIWKAANPKGHLLTAISFLIPIVCGSGFIIAIGMGLGGTVQQTLLPGQFDLWQAFATLGARALGLLPVVIAIGISGSIAGKPGIAPGFVTGLAANEISAGFIGGMIGGYIAGYIAVTIIKNVKVPDWARGLMPTLIVPFFASVISCLVMLYIIGTPIGIFTDALTSLLRNMGTSSNLVLGAVIGALCIVDFGGPINKTCFAFVLTLQAQGINEPITALQLVNTATPVGFGLAYFIARLLRKNIYNNAEIETLKSAVPMGIVNIVEGSIPIVMNDIVRGVSAAAIGGACGGAITMVYGADATVPFGGVLMIPTMSQPMAGVMALLVNILVTGVVYAIIKKNVPRDVMTDDSSEEEDIHMDDIKIS
ncbi:MULTISPECIES: PTS fructose transporter subunit IIC [unclassified Tatumella]|uniref:PTS fructose transporter subunit IIC n=1 Tax=unclassified Tatumella TaxID=2649542 RepID=UPI001BB0C9E4|nr:MULTISPECIES: PTS fructose transporter subunit IIC [unclassified Tatumella]MBS0856056.1 PTS fructose transporter subunit IIC [Tatumella sp. JGM16]MBS0878115.1 PTS fructose transporter subunit IIC [Tatumella sp. JGM82]MBS0890474.1 PTS fructose transporter subunit IIC [Tatumella sp. JGM94]MBS0900930.1 PTS fructose transporter subunit IIC [Tatumella sp. JGM100]MBS0913035.1 PTS fructose transporter subunit IIC [Tatumella sp. JGM91]